MINPKKSICIATYNRPKELSLCLKMLSNCKLIDEFNVVILFHEENMDSLSVINLFNYRYKHVLSVKGVDKTPLENMNNNRLILLKYCFEKLESDYVVSIEDDVLLSYDSLVFSDFIISKFSKKFFFRGVNLGSLENKKEVDKSSYGLFRYGLSGQGGVITRKVWKKINKLDLLKNLSKEGFDSLVEAYWKTGFVISPYASRYMDIGWRGTHAPKDPKHSYYSKLKQSWLGPRKVFIKKYLKKDDHYFWRHDCLKYISWHNPYYLLKFIKTKFK